MVYDLNTDIDRERFKRRANALMTRRAVVECSERKPRRTSPQNRYLHVILGEFAMQTGCTLSYVKTEYFKRFCNPELFVRVEFDELMHKEIERLRSGPRHRRDDNGNRAFPQLGGRGGRDRPAIAWRGGVDRLHRKGDATPANMAMIWQEYEL